MFVNKVEEQKFELMRAIFRNMYYKEKSQHLDSECQMLADRVINLQLSRAEENEKILVMKKELNDLKAEEDQTMVALNAKNEKIDDLLSVLENEQTSMFSSLHEDKSISETLQLKNKMIKCLQEQLVKVRLNQAETWAMIRDLKKSAMDLENEKEVLLKIQPETVSRLQEELMSAKLRETQIKNEFENIKKCLTILKSELQQHVQGFPQTKNVDGEIKLSAFGALWQHSSEKKTKKTDQNAKSLEDEAKFLKNKMPELQKQLELINKQFLFKEKEKGILHDRIEAARIKERSVEAMIAERRRQIEQLDYSVREKIVGIRYKRVNKIKNIDELSEKAEDLSSLELADFPPEDDHEEVVVHQLEDKVKILQDRISELKSELKSFKTAPPLLEVEYEDL